MKVRPLHDRLVVRREGNQQQMLQRFPNLAGALPALSVAWLDGDHSQDPFGALP